MEIKLLQKGEREFLEHFEKHSHFEYLKKEETHKEDVHKKIKEFIQQIHKEVESLPEVRKEAEIHHQSLETISNILAQAINIALVEGIIEGLKYISATKSPYLIDAFHDLLAGHFFKMLVQYNKIKLIQ